MGFNTGPRAILRPDLARRQFLAVILFGLVLSVRSSST
jgi:hypothetical protein